MALHAGGLVDKSTLGSSMKDHLNYIRKQDTYKLQYGIDSDFRIIHKFKHNSKLYDQVYAVLDYKRNGKLPDDLTYAEVVDYNETIKAVPGPGSPQLVQKHVFILLIDFDISGPTINSISVFKYLGGNPRPQESGLPAVVVIDGVDKEQNINGVRIELKTEMPNLTFEQYMVWESNYRRIRTVEAKKVLREREFLTGHNKV